MKEILKFTFIIGTVLSLVSDFFTRDYTHAIFFWDKIPALDTIYGLAGCLILIGFAKNMVYRWLHREDNYYD